MSLYNMMCGNNPLFKLLHAVIETKGPLPKIPRYRDTYTNEENGQAFVVIYTRTGGGNREGYESENEAMAAHPLYERDFDNDYDATFAHFVFRVPDEWQEKVLKLHALMSRTDKGATPTRKFEMSMASLKGEEIERPEQLSANEIGELDELIRAMAKELGLIE